MTPPVSPRPPSGGPSHVNPDGSPVVAGPHPRGCARAHTKRDKWLLAAVAAALFFVISNPATYRVTGGLFRLLGITTASKGGCPNALGFAIHVVVFMLLIRWFVT